MHLLHEFTGTIMGRAYHWPFFRKDLEVQLEAGTHPIAAVFFHCLVAVNDQGSS